MEEVAEPQRLSRMRRTIGAHMVRSLQVAAQTTTVFEVDTSEVERARREAGTTALAYFAKASIDAVEGFPQINATLDGEEVTYHSSVNLGIAVSLGEQGLIVPVIRGADGMSVAELAASIASLARRARERQLSPDDVAGGTFTLSNTGAFGSVINTPIINQPQVAILTTEATVRRPVVVGEGDDERIEVRPITNLCLTWDHRLIDGSVASRYLAAVRDNLEAPQGS